MRAIAKEWHTDMKAFQDDGSLQLPYPRSRCLAIDCSTDSLTVALLENGKLCTQIQERAQRNHSVVLLPRIHQLLSSQGFHAADVHMVAVGQGPGSYTGVRIAASVAKTLAWSLDLDLIGVSSLAAMALGAYRRYISLYLSSATAHSRVWVIPFIDARRGQAFTGLYQVQGDTVSAIIPDHIRLVAPWIEYVSKLAHQGHKDAKDPYLADEELPTRIIYVTEVTNDTLHQEDQLLRGIEVQWVTQAIEAYDVGMLAYLRKAAGHQNDVHKFAPHYAQLPEAEVNLQAKVMKGEDGCGTRE